MAHVSHPPPPGPDAAPPSPQMASVHSANVACFTWDTQSVLPLERVAIQGPWKALCDLQAVLRGRGVICAAGWPHCGSLTALARLSETAAILSEVNRTASCTLSKSAASEDDLRRDLPALLDATLAAEMVRSGYWRDRAWWHADDASVASWRWEWPSGSTAPRLHIALGVATSSASGPLCSPLLAEGASVRTPSGAIGVVERVLRHSGQAEVQMSPSGSLVALGQRRFVYPLDRLRIIKNPHHLPKVSDFDDFVPPVVRGWDGDAMLWDRKTVDEDEGDEETTDPNKSHGSPATPVTPTMMSLLRGPPPSAPAPEINEEYLAPTPGAYTYGAYLGTDQVDSPALSASSAAVSATAGPTVHTEAEPEIADSLLDEMDNFDDMNSEWIKDLDAPQNIGASASAAAASSAPSAPVPGQASDPFREPSPVPNALFENGREVMLAGGDRSTLNRVMEISRGSPMEIDEESENSWSETFTPSPAPSPLTPMAYAPISPGAWPRLVPSAYAPLMMSQTRAPKKDELLHCRYSPASSSPASLSPAMPVKMTPPAEKSKRPKRPLGALSSSVAALSSLKAEESTYLEDLLISPAKKGRDYEDVNLDDETSEGDDDGNHDAQTDALLVLDSLTTSFCDFHSVAVDSGLVGDVAMSLEVRKAAVEAASAAQISPDLPRALRALAMACEHDSIRSILGNRCKAAVSLDTAVADSSRVLVGHLGSWLPIAPPALQFWSKLRLEPYARKKHVQYVLVADQHALSKLDIDAGHVQLVWKALNSMYTQCCLGQHNALPWNYVPPPSSATHLSPADDYALQCRAAGRYASQHVSLYHKHVLVVYLLHNATSASQLRSFRIALLKGAGSVASEIVTQCIPVPWVQRAMSPVHLRTVAFDTYSKCRRVRAATQWQTKRKETASARPLLHEPLIALPPSTNPISLYCVFNYIPASRTTVAVLCDSRGLRIDAFVVRTRGVTSGHIHSLWSHVVRATPAVPPSGPWHLNLSSMSPLSPSELSAWSSYLSTEFSDAGRRAYLADFFASVKLTAVFPESVIQCDVETPAESTVILRGSPLSMRLDNRDRLVHVSIALHPSPSMPHLAVHVYSYHSLPDNDDEVDLAKEAASTAAECAALRMLSAALDGKSAVSHPLPHSIAARLSALVNASSADYDYSQWTEVEVQ